MRRPITERPTFTQKSDGSKILDDVEESTWVYWEERSKASEGRVERTMRQIASALADQHIKRERFRRAFMRVSVKRGAPTLLLYEREEYDAAAPLKIYDLANVSDISKEDLPKKESLAFQIKNDPALVAASQEAAEAETEAAAAAAAATKPVTSIKNAEGGDADASTTANAAKPTSTTTKTPPTTPRGTLRSTEFVNIYGQILLRLHLGARRKRTDGKLLSALGLGGKIGSSKKKSGDDGTGAGGDSGGSGGAGGGGGGGATGSSGGDADDGSLSGSGDSICLAFYTTEDRDVWYSWFCDLAVLRHRALIEANTDFFDEVDDPSPSLFGFSTTSAAGTTSSGDPMTMMRMPIVGERAFLRSARGRDALRDYARMFLESGASSALDVQSMGTVHASRNGGDSFQPAELAGIVSAGEVSLKFKVGPIVKESFTLSMHEYRIEASSSSERELFLWFRSANAVTAVMDAAAAKKKQQQQQQQQAGRKSITSGGAGGAGGGEKIASSKTVIEEHFNWVLRSTSFEGRAGLVSWLRRIKGKGEPAQTEEETFPYLRGMLKSKAAAESPPTSPISSPPHGSPDSSPATRMRNRLGESSGDVPFGELPLDGGSMKDSSRFEEGNNGGQGRSPPQQQDLGAHEMKRSATATAAAAVSPSSFFNRVGDPLLDGTHTPRSDEGECARSDDGSVADFAPFCTFVADVVDPYLNESAQLWLYGPMMHGVSGAGGHADRAWRTTMARGHLSTYGAATHAVESRRGAAALPGSTGLSFTGAAKVATAIARARRTVTPTSSGGQKNAAAAGSRNYRTSSAGASSRAPLVPSGAFSRHDLTARR